MSHAFLKLATTPAVAAAQAAHGSREAYARREAGPPTHDRLGPDEAEFIAARDGFYLASVSETGWPYVQHRGGAPGFLQVLGERLLGFAELRGNRQYITEGNTTADPRVALFLMDYPNRRRLKLLGRLRKLDPVRDAEAAARFSMPDGVRVEGVRLIEVEAFDWNCPQHITPRYTQAELAPMVAPLVEERDRLAAENRALRAALASRATQA